MEAPSRKRDWAEVVDQLELAVFTPAPVILSGTKWSRRILAVQYLLQLNWCEDSSIPLRFTRNDKPDCAEQLLEKLEFIGQCAIASVGAIIDRPAVHPFEFAESQCEHERFLCAGA